MDTLLEELQAKPQNASSERGKISPNRRGIKKTNKKGSRVEVRGSLRGQGNSRGSERQIAEDETTKAPTGIQRFDNIDRMNLLDYLISPLKIDLVFGFVIRNVVGKGNRDFRVLSVHFRQAFWHS